MSQKKFLSSNVKMIINAHQSCGRHNEWLLLTVYVHSHPDTMHEIGSKCQLPESCPNMTGQYVTNWTYKNAKFI